MSVHALPYIANLLILLPVLPALVRTAEGAFPNSPDAPAMRLLIVALWGGVAALSALALLLGPERFWPILLFQAIYKAAYLGLMTPRIAARAPDVPWGPVAIFVPIVAIWPFFALSAMGP